MLCIPNDTNTSKASHSFQVVEAIEAELKTTERNVPKIRMILSSMDNSSISSQEHLHNREVKQCNFNSYQHVSCRYPLTRRLFFKWSQIHKTINETCLCQSIQRWSWPMSSQCGGHWRRWRAARWRSGSHREQRRVWWSSQEFDYSWRISQSWNISPSNRPFCWRYNMTSIQQVTHFICCCRFVKDWTKVIVTATLFSLFLSSVFVSQRTRFVGRRGRRGRVYIMAWPQAPILFKRCYTDLQETFSR